MEVTVELSASDGEAASTNGISNDGSRSALNSANGNVLSSTASMNAVTVEPTPAASSNLQRPISAAPLPAREGAPAPASSPCRLMTMPRRPVIAMARFLMAARDPSLRKAQGVPPLLPATASDHLLYEQGQERQRTRTLRRTQATAAAAATAAPALAQSTSVKGAVRQPAAASSTPELPLQVSGKPDSQSSPGLQGGIEPDWDVICSSCAASAVAESTATASTSSRGSSSSPPSPPGSPTTRTVAPSPALASPRSPSLAPTLPPTDLLAPLPPTSLSAIPIRWTEVRHVCLSRHEDRNTTGTLFGGQGLRLAYEVGQAAAVRHAGGAPCDLLCLDDVAFLEPVPMGAPIHVTARIVYTEGAEMHAVVVAQYGAVPAPLDEAVNRRVGTESGEPGVAGSVRAEVLDASVIPALRTAHTLTAVFMRQDSEALRGVRAESAGEVEEAAAAQLRCQGA